MKGNRLLMTLSVIGIFAVLLTAASADGDPAGVNKAKKLIETEQAVIAVFAHPTAKLTSIEYEDCTKQEFGFKLIYKLNYDSAAKRSFYSRLAFGFDKDGTYQSVESVSTSSFVNPFSAADVAIRYLEDTIIKSNPVLRKDKLLQELIKKADAKALLGFVLKTAK